MDDRVMPDRRSRLVVVGEALVDLVVRPDGTVTATPGGGPYNTARTAARLGVATTFLGRCSADAFGRRLVGELTAAGVDQTGVVATDDPTTLAVAELDGAGVATYRFHLAGTSAPGLTLDDIPATWSADLAALHVGTLGLVMEPIGTTVEALVGQAPAETLVIVDPNARPSATPDLAVLRRRLDRLATRADVMKVSEDDLRVLGPGAPETTIAGLLRRGVAVVIRTDGGRPVEIHRASGVITVEVPEVAVVDTVGAGDAFGGGFLAAWIGSGRCRAELRDDDAVREAVRSGVEVAAMTCQRVGADPPTRAELAAATGRLPT